MKRPQREFYSIYLKLYQALMTSIRGHVAPRDIITTAVTKMDDIMKDFHFADSKIQAAAAAFVNGFRRGNTNSLGHSVGMEVHDVRMTAPTLEPGVVFTIEPAMQIEDEHLGIRLEDMILITESGYENLSAFMPVEIDAIEKLMAQPGLSDQAIK